MPSRIDLIAGLGNPGSDYAKTRHNVGFWFLDEFARQNNLTFQTQSKFFGETAMFRATQMTQYGVAVLEKEPAILCGRRLVLGHLGRSEHGNITLKEY